MKGENYYIPGKNIRREKKRHYWAISGHSFLEIRFTVLCQIRSYSASLLFVLTMARDKIHTKPSGLIVYIWSLP